MIRPCGRGLPCGERRARLTAHGSGPTIAIRVVERHEQTGQLPGLPQIPTPGEKPHGHSRSRSQRGILRERFAQMREKSAEYTGIHGCRRHRESSSGPRRRVAARRRGLQPGGRPGAPDARVPRGSARPTRASSAARARTSSSIRGAWRRSVPSCGWTSRRSPRRCCTTSSRTRTPISTTCARSSGARSRSSWRASPS